MCSCLQYSFMGIAYCSTGSVISVKQNFVHDGSLLQHWMVSSPGRSRVHGGNVAGTLVPTKPHCKRLCVPQPDAMFAGTHAPSQLAWFLQHVIALCRTVLLGGDALQPSMTKMAYTRQLCWLVATRCSTVVLSHISAAKPQAHVEGQQRRISG
jgi:hypothetical protein